MGSLFKNAQEIDPGMRAQEDKPDLDEEKLGITKKWYVTMPDGTHAYISENDKNKVWLDASRLEEGVSGGTKLYLLVGSYAEGNGKVFVGDPKGLSDVALLRRTENMVSLALRYGHTDFLMPHDYQMNPDAKQDSVLKELARPITWDVDDNENNIEELLRTSYTNTTNLVPEIKDVTFNFDTMQFERGGKDSPTLTESLSVELIQYANGVFPKSSPESMQEWRERRDKGRLSESLRLKERLSQIPFYAKRALEEGETYWLKLAESYQGD